MVTDEEACGIYRGLGPRKSKVYLVCCPHKAGQINPPGESKGLSSFLSLTHQLPVAGLQAHIQVGWLALADRWEVYCGPRTPRGSR